MLAVYGGVLLVAAAAIFTRLDDRLLWGDEAETALLGANIARTGVCRISDGRIAVQMGDQQVKGNKAGIWIWTPWLDKYVTAGSILLLGRTTLGARLPFAVVGWLTVLFVMRLAWRVFRRHDLAILAALLLAGNVTFLLHVRQCRYYALVMFGQAWLIWGFHRLITGSIRRGAFQIFSALTAQFYCNYLALPANVLALVLAAIPAARRDRRILRALPLALLAVGALATPWVLYAGLLAQAGSRSAPNLWHVLGYNAAETHFHFIPISLIFVSAGIAVVRRVRPEAAAASHRASASNVPSPAAPEAESKHARVVDEESRRAQRSVLLFLWLLLALHVVVPCVIPWGLLFLRYLLPLAPVCALLIAAILTRQISHRVLRYALAALLIGTNWIAVATGPRLSECHRYTHMRGIDPKCDVADGYPLHGPHGFDVPLASYVRELSGHYRDRFSEVVGYLRAHAKLGEELSAWDPEMPTMFYTDLRLTDMHRIRATDRPDWFMPTSASGTLDMSPRLLDTASKRYDRIALTVPDTPRLGCLPDPDVHAYVTAPKESTFVMWQRKRAVTRPPG